MNPLTEKEKKFVALAIFTFVMRAGEDSFSIPFIEGVIEKIGIEEEFSFYAEDWIAYSKRTKNEKF